MPSSILLFSAGLDSTVNLKRAVDEGRVMCALTFDYGQRAAACEIEYSARACRRFCLRHEVIQLPWLKKITSTSLVNRRSNVPQPRQSRLDDAKAAEATAEKVWVPNRNGAFLAIAASFAEALGADQVVTGFNAEEAATFPDNSVAFLNATNRALRFSTKTGVRAVSYTSRLRKIDIVRMGMKIEAPLDLVWCCYLGGKRICGLCESCGRFLRAVHDAGAEDWFRAHHAGFRRGKI